MKNINLKEKKVSNIGIFIICIIVVLISLYLIKNSTDSKNLSISKGYIDLSNIDLNNGPYSISGEWEFYYDKLIQSEEEFNKNENTYLNLPGTWTKYKEGDEYLKSKGKATYRLKIKVNSLQQNIGIKFNNVWGKSRVIIKDDNKIISEEDFSSEVVRTNYFNINSDEFEILIQIKNEDVLKSGILKSIYIGSEESITSFRDKYLFIDIASIVSFIMLAFYFISKSFDEKNILANISLGIYSFTVATFISLTDEILISRIFINISMGDIYKLTILVGAISTISLIVYVNDCYKIGLSKKLITRFSVFYSIYLLIVLTLPIFRKIDIGRIQAISGTSIIIIGLVIMIKSIFSKKEEAKFNILALLSILLLTLVVIYNTFSQKQINFLIPIYVFIFIISQAMLLSYKYINSVREIEMLSNKLKILDKRKDEFLERTSYELKLPLKGILNISNSLIDGIAGEINKEQKDNIELIASVSNRLNILVDDILDYSNFSNGYIESKKNIVNIKSILFLVINISEYSIKNRPISIENKICTESILVNGDDNRLKQVFYNLIDTLLIFTDKGKINISTDIKEDKVIISIKNENLFIKEGEKIFYSLENIDWDNDLYSHKKRSGIGLWVAKTIIDIHEGKIIFSSSEELGTEFNIILPTIYSTEIKEVSIIEDYIKDIETLDLSPNLREDNNYRILILESNEISSKVLRNSLNSEGYITKNLSSSEELLNLLEDGIKEDLLIINSFLPNSSGYELLRKIREKYNSIDLPIIMVVDNAYPENIPLALHLDANDVLIEPYDIDELKARVSTLIQLKKAIASLIDSEMAFLKAQIKPHFIFNALSVISSLITRNPEKAKSLLLDFSDYLRSSFDFNSGDDLVDIYKEIEITKAYVAIEKERFKNRLKVDFNIENEINVRIPSLIIQPIVENAIRHGVLNKIEGGNIEVDIYKDIDYLFINIKDDGIGITKERIDILLKGIDKSAGVGIKNINNRLIRKYGQGIIINSIEGKGTEVIIKIPLV